MNELGFDLAFKMFVEPTPELGWWEVVWRQNINVPNNSTTGMPDTIY
jgi:hypothetical protein